MPPPEVRRLSPVHPWHRQQGAVFAEHAGWEVVERYEPNESVEAECRAVREAVALFDRTPLTRLEVEGSGAESFLGVICEEGGVEHDFHLTRLGEGRFSIVVEPERGDRVREWLRSRLPGGDEVRVDDVTSRWACFGIWGPRSREVLQPLTRLDLGGEAFPEMSLREALVAGVPVRMLRAAPGEEFGWEVWCPTEYGLGLWEALWEAGRPHGIAAVGGRAIETLRLDSGERA